MEKGRRAVDRGGVNLDQLEPAAAERMRERVAGGYGVREEEGQSMMTHSLAVSMKRCADALERIAAALEKSEPI